MKGRKGVHDFSIHHPSIPQLISPSSFLPSILPSITLSIDIMMHFPSVHPSIASNADNVKPSQFGKQSQITHATCPYIYFNQGRHPKNAQDQDRKRKRRSRRKKVNGKGGFDRALWLSYFMHFISISLHAWNEMHLRWEKSKKLSSTVEVFALTQVILWLFFFFLFFPPTVNSDKRCRWVNA